MWSSCDYHVTIGIYNTLDIRVTVKVCQLLCGSQEDGVPPKLTKQLQLRNSCTCRGVRRRDKEIWRLSYQKSMDFSLYHLPLPPPSISPHIPLPTTYGCFQPQLYYPHVYTLLPQISSPIPASGIWAEICEKDYPLPSYLTPLNRHSRFPPHFTPCHPQPPISIASLPTLLLLPPLLACTMGLSCSSDGDSHINTLPLLVALLLKVISSNLYRHS